MHRFAEQQYCGRPIGLQHSRLVHSPYYYLKTSLGAVRWNVQHKSPHQAQWQSRTTHWPNLSLPVTTGLAAVRLEVLHDHHGRKSIKMRTAVQNSIPELCWAIFKTPESIDPPLASLNSAIFISSSTSSIVSPISALVRWKIAKNCICQLIWITSASLVASSPCSQNE